MTGAYVYVLQIRRGKKDNLRDNLVLLHKNIFCDPSLELSYRDSSNVGSQHMFSLRNKKIIFQFSSVLPLIWGSDVFIIHSQWLRLINYDLLNIEDRHPYNLFLYLFQNRPKPVEPIDYETYVVKNKVVLHNDPQREMLTFPFDDIESPVSWMLYTFCRAPYTSLLLILSGSLGPCSSLYIPYLFSYKTGVSPL